MSTKVRACCLNGVFTPLEPLDLEEGAVVELDVAVPREIYLEKAIAEVKQELEDICNLPDDRPKKYKLFLDAEDTLMYLEGERRSKERRR